MRWIVCDLGGLIVCWFLYNLVAWFNSVAFILWFLYAFVFIKLFIWLGLVGLLIVILLVVCFCGLCLVCSAANWFGCL